MAKTLSFIKSSLCGWGAMCVEAAKSGDNIIVRDSKNPTKETLSFTSEEWNAFIQGVKNNEFDF